MIVMVGTEFLDVAPAVIVAFIGFGTNLFYMLRHGEVLLPEFLNL
jgi:hypothetical protein